MTDEFLDALLISVDFFSNGVSFTPFFLNFLLNHTLKGDCGITIQDVSLDSDDGDWQCQVTASRLGEKTLQSQVIRLLVLINPDRPTIHRYVSYLFVYSVSCSLPFSWEITFPVLISMHHFRQNTHSPFSSWQQNQQGYSSDYQVIVNEPNKIECSVSNGNPAPKISWFLNGRNITEYVSQLPSCLLISCMTHDWLIHLHQ